MWEAQKRGGRERKASSLPAPFNVFYTGCPSFHLVSLCANRSRMWDKSVYCFWLLVHSFYLHPQTTWGSYYKMEISLFQLAFIVSLRMTNLLVTKEVAGILGTMSAVCCIQQLDSNLFTLIFDISMFNTGLPWLVKSGEKAIIWGREKLTGKSLRSQEVSFSGCHSIPGIWNRCQKRFVVDWYWFSKSGKKHHILKTLSEGKWKTHNLQEKDERNVKVWKPFSGQWNVAITMVYCLE